MKNSKLLRLLSHFSKEEFKKFGLFVNSPYFNRLKNVTRLYDILKKHHPEFNSRNLTKEFIYDNIFPGLKYNDIKLRTIFSYLLTLAEKFIASENYLSNPFYTKIETVNTLEEMEEYTLIDENIREAKSLVKNSKERNSEYYYNLFRVIYLQNTYTDHYSEKMKLQKENDALTVYYITTVLRTFGSAFNIMSSLNISLRTELIEIAVSLAQKDPYKRIPIVKLNYALYMLSRYNDDEKYFANFLRLAEKYPDVYSSREMLNIYRLLVNYCVLKVQKGITKYIDIKFSIYKKMLSQNIHGKNMNYTIFSNIVVSALQCNDAEFAGEFIANYKHLLNPKIKTDIIEISYARIFYHEKKYNEALEHLSKTGSNDDIFYKLAIKDLSIRIFYDRGDHEQVYSIIDSYKHFLYKNPLLTGDTKKRYRKYLNVLTELLRITIKPEKNKVLELKKKLENEPGFIYKEWIIDRIKMIRSL